MFADPDFDGDPIEVVDEPVLPESVPPEPPPEPPGPREPPLPPDPPPPTPRKFYVDGGHVEIAAELAYLFDSDGRRMRVVEFTDYTAENVRTMYASIEGLRTDWIDPKRRSDIIDKLAERGIEFEQLAMAAQQPDADAFDLLCHLAFNAPLRTRHERAERLRKNKTDFFDQYGPEARVILNELLDRYTEHGAPQFVMPDVLKLRPISDHGNVMEIARMFGGPEKLSEAVASLQSLLYAA
jgi:type I restriction enzyme R subunit